jgi:hypothetical protein
VMMGHSAVIHMQTMVEIAFAADGVERVFLRDQTE